MSIFIHVGPHKTGTTHIQQYLTSHRSTLAENGICWPEIYSKDYYVKVVGKGLSQIAFDLLHSNRISSYMLTVLENSFSPNLSIVLSAEDLSTLSEDKIRILQKTLLQLGNQFRREITFKVVIFYRESLSRLYSRFAEWSKKNEAGATSFSRFLFHHMDTIQTLSQFATVDLVDRYTGVFGMNNTIVNYDGVNAAKKDIVYVFVCEILQVLCDQVTTLKGARSHENEKPNVLFLHLVYLLRNHIASRGWKFCQFNATAILDLVKSYQKQGLISLPTKKSHLKLLHSHSQQVDESLRRKYLSILWYDNQTATHRVRQELQVEEIDEEAFYDDIRWIQFLDDELNRLKRTDKLCPKHTYQPSDGLE